jgi:hypothetical protein
VEQREALTFRLERFRALGMGVLETANATFLLLIAHRVFAAGPAVKGLIQSSGSLGLLLSPLIVIWAATRGLDAGRAASRLFAVGAVALLVAAATPWLPVFVGGVLVAFVCVAGAAPFFAGIYEANYRADRRGDLFSRNVMVRIAGSILFAWGAGWLLDRHEGAWPVVMVTYAVALGVGAACLRRCPAVVVSAGAGTHPLRAFRVVGEDPVFRWTLVSWMLMGFANLTMFPLRVEYLSNRRYGLDLSAEEVALLTSVIPNVARLCFTRAWGRLFDRMNFLTLRALLNTGFMLGILSFFTGGGMTGLVAGALLFGVSNAGADVAWTLWVTKFAPPGRVTEYMAVHTFLTGLRGVVAPFAAFYLALHAGIATTAVVMAGMILVASLILPRGKSRAAQGS